MSLAEESTTPELTEAIGRARARLADLDARLTEDDSLVVIIAWREGGPKGGTHVVVRAPDQDAAIDLANEVPRLVATDLT